MVADKDEKVDRGQIIQSLVGHRIHFGFYSKVLRSHWRAKSQVMLVHRASDWLGVSSSQGRKREMEDIKDSFHLLHNSSNGQSWLENEER